MLDGQEPDLEDEGEATPMYHHNECLSCKWYGVDCKTGRKQNEYPEPCLRYVPDAREEEEYLPDEDIREEVEAYT